MRHINYREANESDIPSMARIRAAEWGTEEYWNTRITGYLNKVLNPQKALLPRIIYVAIHDDALVGFIAGHLSTRYECDAELQWINVNSNYRRIGIASQLFRLIAKWFVDQSAYRICVDPDEPARQFYIKNGAVKLNDHWLMWEEIRTLLKEVKDNE